MTQPLDLDALEALAKAASPGPWRLMHGDVFTACDVDDDALYIAGDAFGPNATYIAAASPDVVLALIAEVRRLREESLRDAAKFSRLRGAAEWLYTIDNDDDDTARSSAVRALGEALETG